MLLPAHHVVGTLGNEFKKLSVSEAGAEVSAHQTIDMTLRLLHAREKGGAARVRAQFANLGDVLDKVVAPLLPQGAERDTLAALSAEVKSVVASVETDLSKFERRWRETLERIESLTAALGSSRTLDAARRQQVVRALVQWEAADLAGQLGDPHSHVAQDETEITSERLQAYVRDRFDEPDLKVTAFRYLPGGFGKLTYLFEVQGKALDGGYVLRRDPGVNFFENDCHRVRVEYQVIRAVHKHGFPAPEALWVDTEHRLLPGGDFLVMRRASGVSGGSVFGASGTIPANLTQTLAQILAHLHTLPQMPELGDLTDCIRTGLWSEPMETVVRRYLEGWRELYLSSHHVPSPATVGLFSWLIDNVPATAGRPVLLHGDIGFHNFVLDGDRLSAVLDWEFAHLGDPAEDLAYVRNTVGRALDWPAFIAAYRDAGGAEVDEARIRFFQVWGQLRNLASANLATVRFDSGEINELKMVLLAHQYIPYFMTAAQAVIDGNGS